jgi:hypothetical protein
MQYLAFSLMGLGWLVGMIAGIMFLVAAFRVSPLWGLAVLFLPFASLIFLIKYWSEAKKAFLGQILAVLVMGSGMAVAMSSGVAGAMATLASSGVQIPPELLEASGDFGALEELGLQVEEEEEEAAAEEAHVNVLTQENFVGQSLEEVKRTLGRPPAIVESEGRVFFVYTARGLQLVSDDGVNVTAQEEIVIE